ncbi:MAG: SDR family oxidoreductase, partial [Christensenellales bacterium]
ALPDMISRRKGSIVNVSSVWGQAGASCEVHYSAAKAAVIGLTRALAKETGSCGVRVNCVAPGAIDTRMLSGLDDAAKSELAGQTPLCRLGTARDAAETIFFLSSEKADFITGQVISVNGGFYI